MGWNKIDVPEEDENGNKEREWDELWNDLTPDDTLTGEVVKVGKGKFGTYLLVSDEDGVIWKTGEHKKLIAAIKKGRIVEGDQVFITYKGEGEQPDNPDINPPKFYELQKWED